MSATDKHETIYLTKHTILQQLYCFACMKILASVKLLKLTKLVSAIVKQETIHLNKQTNKQTYFTT